ncbi:MAG: leucyl aminopeptidase [Planctomycetes bacterium]|nr:leucyl aminopeptidase [Planctomycetota bacterium]
MEATVRRTSPGDDPPQGLLVWLFEEDLESSLPSEVDRWVGGDSDRILSRAEFRGRLGDVLEMGPCGNGGPERLAFAGLGKRSEYEIDHVRRAAAAGIGRLVAAGVSRPAVLLRDLPCLPAEAARAAVEGGILSSYRFDEYKQAPRPKCTLERIEIALAEPRDLADIEEAARVGRIVAEQVLAARDLGNRPPNRKTPVHLGEYATEMAARRGIECRVFTGAQVEALRMPCFLGVARGSAEPPTLLVLEHGKKYRGRRPTIALVGKGITFDSGGISIKPAENMELMKFDMCGAAAVLAAIEGAARLALDLHIVAIAPCCENLPGGKALKPADCLETRAGKTVEIVSTDAEGRLILADALSYAATEFEPSLIIDLATLTGACVVALGRRTSGLFGTDEDAKCELAEVGRWTGDRVWPLPIAEDHHEGVKGDTADLKNSGGKWGGASTAAAFLSNFVHGRPWIHLDIAPTAWSEENRPEGPKGATGAGVRLLLEFLRRRSEAP